MNNKLKNLFHIAFIGLMMFVLIMCIFDGISNEMDRRDNTRVERRWMHQQAILEMETER